jgi:taurine dioxygenase
MRNSAVDIRPVSAYSGAEIHGVDLSKPLAEQPYREIRTALCEYGAVFFRDQNLTPEQLVTLGKRFGELHVSKYIAKVPGNPDVAEVRKEPEQTRNTGGQWHTDHAYADMPPLGSILQAQELPKTGGDTMFANMCAAYDSLSEGIKKTLLTMRAHHAKSKALDNSKLAPERRVDMAERSTIGRDNSERATVHPVTPRHPETGRRILFVNPTYTTRFEGWSVEESEPLLSYLYEHGKRPEYQCRFHWEVGSIVFWDNRTSWHYALNDYHGERRLMHRVSVQGPGFDPS